MLEAWGTIPARWRVGRLAANRVLQPPVPRMRQCCQPRTPHSSSVPAVADRPSSVNGAAGSTGGAPETRSRLMPLRKVFIGISATRLPPSITPTQSQMRSCSCTRWLLTSTVAPRADTYSTSAPSTSRRTTGSSPSVGSSSTSNSGLVDSARSIISLPDSPLLNRSMRCSCRRLNCRRNSSARAASHVTKKARCRSIISLTVSDWYRCARSGT